MTSDIVDHRITQGVQPFIREHVVKQHHAVIVKLVRQPRCRNAAEVDDLKAQWLERGNRSAGYVVDVGEVALLLAVAIDSDRLLLSDLPWARSVFGESVAYCPIGSPAQTAANLKSFYDAAPRTSKPMHPITWQEAGAQYQAIYAEVFGVSK